MDSQKTTHILLIILIIGVFFLIFLYMFGKNPNYIIPVETVTEITPTPVTEPINTPIQTPAPVITPNPTTPELAFNPNNYPLTIESISRGDLMLLTRTNSDTSGILWAFCEKSTENSIWFFARLDDSNCQNQEDVVTVDTKMLRVLLKPGYGIDDLEKLNTLYGVRTATNGFSNGSSVEYWLEIPSSSSYNSIALARVYFATGYFSVAEPFLGPMTTEGEPLN